MTIEMLRSRFAALSHRDKRMGAALLFAAAVLLYLVQTPASSAVIESPAPVRAPEEDATREVIGLDAAARRPELRNPFTYAHETRGEGAHTEETPPTADEKRQGAETPASMMPAARTSATAPALPDGTAQPAKELRPILRGTVTGADGRCIAILAMGEESAAVAAGDTWRDYAVEDAHDNAVTLRRGAETLTLRRE